MEFLQMKNITWRGFLPLLAVFLFACAADYVYPDNRCKAVIEFGDSTTRQRGDLVGQSLGACDIYVNRGYDGQTTAQVVDGLDGANGFTGETFEQAMAGLKAWNAERLTKQLPDYRIVIVINEGINDRLKRYAVDDSIANIKKLVNQTQGFEVLVVLPNKLCLDLDLAEYVDQLKVLKLPVADVYSMALNLPDCIHPDKAGREASAKVVAEAVNKL